METLLYSCTKKALNFSSTLNVFQTVNKQPQQLISFQQNKEPFLYIKHEMIFRYAHFYYDDWLWTFYYEVNFNPLNPNDLIFRQSFAVNLNSLILFPNTHQHKMQCLPSNFIKIKWEVTVTKLTCRRLNLTCTCLLLCQLGI